MLQWRGQKISATPLHFINGGTVSFRKKLLVVIALIVLAGLTGAAAPKSGQAAVQQPKLVVFESVGSTT